jgi:hypothetical protein
VAAAVMSFTPGEAAVQGECVRLLLQLLLKITQLLSVLVEEELAQVKPL